MRLASVISKRYSSLLFVLVVGEGRFDPRADGAWAGIAEVSECSERCVRKENN